MGGVIGAVSTKFVITAGAVLLSARVGMHPIKAVLDPSVQTTLITPKVAALRQNASDGALIDSDRWIGLGAHMLRIRKFAVSSSIPADSVLGADVLKSGAFLLNFQTHQIDLLEAGQIRRVTSGMKPLPIVASSDGCLAVVGADEEGQPVSAALIGRPDGDQTEASRTLRVDTIRLTAAVPAQAICPASKLALHWSAFDGRRIVLDFGHERIWVTSDGKEN